MIELEVSDSVDIESLWSRIGERERAEEGGGSGVENDSVLCHPASRDQSDERTHSGRMKTLMEVGVRILSCVHPDTWSVLPSGIISFIYAHDGFIVSYATC